MFRSAYRALSAARRIRFRPFGSLNRRPIALNTPGTKQMKAIVQTGYGLPHALQLSEVGIPRIGDAEVLVRVHAAAVNALEQRLSIGHPVR